MKLQHEDLDDFEPVIKELYTISFFTEKTTEKIIFPSRLSYTANYLNDYNKAQNLIAKEVITVFELKKKKEQELKNQRKVRTLDKELVGRLIQIIETLENRILVLRRLFDTIAFKFFEGKIWVAKRFILHKKMNAPDIQAIKNNLEAANSFNANNQLNFALVSDLTTFIEVGDLIFRMNKNGDFKWLIVELKTGKVNVDLFNLIDEGLPINTQLAESFDEHTTQQLKRILKQKERTEKIVELVKNNKGVDIRNGMQIELRENNILWHYYHKQLNETAIAAKQKQVALCVIQECFTIFASCLSDEETSHYFYHIINPGIDCALKNTSKQEAISEIQKCRKILSHSYVKDLTLHNMYARWRTPFFALPVDEVIFDLLFKRMRILLYLDIDKFIELCRSKGYKVEFLNRKETNEILSKAPKTPLYKGRAIKVFLSNGKSTVIGDGLFNRLFFDMVTPSTLIDILSTLST